MTTPVDLDSLDALVEAATPGDWHSAGANVVDYELGSVCVCDETFEPDDDTERNRATSNAHAIAALRNAWPLVSAELRRAMCAGNRGVDGERERPLGTGADDA